MKRLKNIQTFEQYSSELNISDVMNSLTIDFVTDILNFLLDYDITTKLVQSYILSKDNISVGDSQFHPIEGMTIDDLTNMVNYFSEEKVSMDDVSKEVLNYFSNYS